MKNEIRLLAYSIVGCVITVSSAGCNPDKTASTFDSAKIVELDAYLTDLQGALPIPALGVVVIKDDAVYYKPVGHALNTTGMKVPFLSSTPFFTGSLSELMVVTGILLLAEEGELDIEDPVAKHLSYFRLGDGDVSSITIRHLMSQTAGIPVHTAMWDYPDYGNKALENTTRSIHLQQPEFAPPGSRVKRSPYNYDILADLIAKVSGIPFEDYMETKVLAQLDMPHSFFPKSVQFINTVAKPHAVKNWLTYDMDTMGTYPSNREHSGSMGWHTSLADLSNWLYMVLHQGMTVDGQRFLDRRKGKLLHTHYPTDTVSAIGFGWEVAHTDLGNVFTHDHDMGGFTANMVMIPEQGIAVAVVSNIAGDFNIQSVSSQLVQWIANDIPLVHVKPLLAATLGRKLAQTNRLDSVFHLYVELKEEKPDAYDYSLESLSQLGVNLLYRVRNQQQAVQFFEYCARLFPESSLVQLNLAEAYLISGKRDEAKATLQRSATKEGAGAQEIQHRTAVLKTALERKNRDNEQPTIF